MNLLELEELLEKREFIYYGRTKINILKIYRPFNLIDVTYENDSSIFTIDVIALEATPSKEIRFKYI
ncbi:hypothetical protein PP175_03915 [Aneurinibacillus sp. Ricciae_BoGa-3]|uniref:hypothetical protein n=1 Tax=Aneurinibacillus sp. Ricciae_BoGa-3 TaxID=3022697 RepID=UPI002340D7A8|nr:hypothetical protein [Aneurinibacillus sp. Ricciae_BoGa-3]WCK55143.1 hypothetical protein PP175_03915 [Aneurinibacillus sp. Ricciae_BoGa-3]